MNSFAQVRSLLSMVVLSSGFLHGAPLPSEAPAIFRQLEAGQSQTVVVYGTSLTHGGQWAVAIKGWFDKAYPGKVKFINSGGPGENSDWGLANLSTKVLAHQPDLVFLEFSYNDAHDKFKMPVERGAENLRKMIEALRAHDPETAIVLQTMNTAWDAPNGKGSLSRRPNLEKYNDNYRTAAQAFSLPLLDHYAFWKALQESDAGTFQRYVPDGTHPTPEGSLAVTWPTVEAWLEAGRAAAHPAAARD